MRGPKHRKRELIVTCPVTMRAIAAVDMAPRDIMGKIAGLPTENLWSSEKYLRSVPPLFNKAREALGWDVHRLHDVHHRLTPIEAGRLGVDIDETLAARYPYKCAYLPVNRLEDGTLFHW